MFTALTLAITAGEIVTAAEVVTAVATAATSVAIAVKASRSNN